MRYHLTAHGPKRCAAEERACPLGGAHFSTKLEAEKAYASLMENGGKLRKRRSLSKNFQEVLEPIPAAYAPLLSPKKKTLVISDVDGTLVKGSLVLDHACYLHEKGLIDLGTWPARWKKDQKNEELIAGLADNYRQAVAGKNLKDLAIPEFISSVVNSPTKLYSSLERLKHHREAGHDVVLISGSPNFLVGPFANYFGFRSFASTYHRNRARQLNGRITGMFYAGAKEGIVEKLDLPSYDRVIGYGDTASDVPLLSKADYAVLVEPNPTTVEVLRSKAVEVSEIIHD